jgi:hypothetical protein
MTTFASRRINILCIRFRITARSLTRLYVRASIICEGQYCM